MTELERRELEQSLRRDLEQLVRDEARLRAAARAAALRGRLRLRAVGARAPARARPRGRDLALGEDRPDRRRPGQRPRDRPGLQVRAHGPLRGRDREGAPAPDPALHAGAARSRRDRAARRALPPARRRAACRAGCCAWRRRTTGCPASRRTTTSTRTRSGAGSRARETWRVARAADPGRATSGTTRRAASAPPGATSGGCAGSGAHERQRHRTSSSGGDRGAGSASSSPPGAGTGKTTVLVERFVRGGLRTRARRRVAARDHLHRACGRRAARPDPGAARRARPARSRALARRRLDLHDPRLLPAAAEVASVRGRARPALPRPRREPGPGHPQRGVRDRARRVLRLGRAGAAAAPRDLRRRRAAPDADERLRDAALGRARARARARGATGARRPARGARRGGAAVSRTTLRRRSSRAAAAAQALEPHRARRSRPSGCSI